MSSDTLRKNEQQATKNAQDSERLPHNEVSEVTTTCDSWKKEPKYSRKVTDRSGGRIAGGGFQHCSCVCRTRPGQPHAKSLTSMEVTTSPLCEMMTSHRNVPEDTLGQNNSLSDGGPMIKFYQTYIALSDTRSMSDESVPKRKEAERFEFETLPQASQFGSREIMINTPAFDP